MRVATLVIFTLWRYLGPEYCLRIIHLNMSTKQVTSPTATLPQSEITPLLQEFYDRGMTSRAKAHSHLHHEASFRTGLPLQTILNWIGNKQKKISGRKYPRKATHTRGMTAFNLYVHENKDNLPNMVDWAAQWKLLGDDEKQNYRDRAQQLPTVTDPKKTLKKIFSLITDLSDVGVDLVCVGKNMEGHQIIFGHGKPLQFFTSREDILDNFYSFCSMGAGDSHHTIIPDRKAAQDHLNDLYSKAIGKEGSFMPYKNIKDGTIHISGLPSEIGVLQPPSQYGAKKLKLIMGVDEIKIVSGDNVTDIHIEEHPDTAIKDIDVRPDDKLVNFRKKAQTHINRLYGVAIGRNTEVNFPYKSYAEKKIILNNLPDSINPLKPPSQYGLVKLKEILSLTELIVSQNEEITHHLTSQTNTLSPPTNTLNSQPHTHTLPTLTSPTLPSPTQTVSSPTHTLTSPTLTSQTHLTYTHPLNSPTHTLNSPTHTLNLPMHTLTSPMHTFTSPMHTFTSPMHTHTSPTHTLTSPTHTLTSPTHTLPTHTSQMHPAEMEIDRNEYVVERIVRRRKKRNGKREYLLRWKGFTAKDDTWEKEENLNPYLLSIASNPKKSD